MNGPRTSFDLALDFDYISDEDKERRSKKDRILDRS